MDYYEVYSNHNVYTMVNNFDEIGPVFNFTVKVCKHFQVSFKYIDSNLFINHGKLKYVLLLV